jgi:putative endopeptidase
MRTLIASLSFGFLTACGSPQAPPGAPGSGVAPLPPAASGAQHKDVTLESVGLEAAALDRGVDPCQDFYQFACGGWIAKTEIPADKPRWVRSFNEIDDRNEADLRSILEQAAASAGGDPVREKVGAYFAGCMDEPAIEKARLEPLRPFMQQARAIRDAKTIAALVAALHQHAIWALFDISAEQDFKDASRYIAYLDQNGLGLPDRDYYLNQDDRSQKLRETYLGHVERMLKLAGTPAAEARRAAADVMHVETELAKVSKTKVERRDPKGLYNKIDRPGVKQAAPRLDWDAYFALLGRPDIADINVTSVRFFEGMNALFSSVKLPAWRSYFSWHVVRAAAPALPKAFVDESFALEQALTGQKEQRARWKRCIDSTDEALGELLAQPYVALRFAGASKTAAEDMVRQIGEAFGRGLDELVWMDPPTRAAARDKLAKMAYLIGYPRAWRQYDFAVSRDRHAQNFLLARAHEVKRDLAKLGKPVDREEWEMTPPTVNAYYHPLKNQMVFPAGILQPPFYSVAAAIPVNLGAMGMVVGHELTHGFDDEGSQFDPLGNLRDWWPAQVRGRFETATQCVERQYSAYEAVPGLHVNGKLTLGENIADIGGVKLAFRAYRALRAGANPTIVADGFNEDQQFFIALGQVWCAKYREEYARLAVQVDPHSPPRYRVNGALANVPEFAQAFACPAGAPMRPDNVCVVW